MSNASRWSELTLRRRVLFHEVDSAGIVHFSNYFRYMEEAEHALWRAAGLSIAKRTSGVGFPRVAASCEYHRPLVFEDEIDVRVAIVAISARSIRYRCTVSRDGERVATGSLTVVCVTKDEHGTMRAVPLPPEIADRFEVAAEDAQ